MSKFGDLLGGNSTPPKPTVVDETPPRPEAEGAESLSAETTDEVDLKSLSKVELEEYGRTIGVELDRRHSKKALVKELEEELKKQE